MVFIHANLLWIRAIMWAIWNGHIWESVCRARQKLKLNREIYISLRDFQGLSCLYLVASWVFHICTLCWEHSSLSVPRPLSYSLLLFTAPSRAPYGLAGALTIYNIKDTASDDGALNLVLLSLFRSCSSDGFIYQQFPTADEQNGRG